jgi:hypothetical protein
LQALFYLPVATDRMFGQWCGRAFAVSANSQRCSFNSQRTTAAGEEALTKSPQGNEPGDGLFAIPRWFTCHRGNLIAAACIYTIALTSPPNSYKSTMAKHHPDLIMCRKQCGVGECLCFVAPAQSV